MTYRIKGWTKFQHFRDRRPPWVKLYRDLLDDPDWHEADPESCKVLVMLWLIASEHENGDLPELRKLSFRLRVSESKLKQILNKLSHWLERIDTERYQDDINVISDQYQLDTPETEKRQIKETEKRQKPQRHVACPVDVPDDTWRDFLAHRVAIKAPITQTAIDGIRREADKAKMTLADALREICARGWRGFKAEWVKKSPSITASEDDPDDPSTWVHKSLRKPKDIDGEAIWTRTITPSFAKS